jgi:hypothetical protein
MVMIAIAQSWQNCGRMNIHKRTLVSTSFKLQQSRLTAPSSSSVTLRMSDDKGKYGPVEAVIENNQYLSDLMNDNIFFDDLHF